MSLRTRLRSIIFTLIIAAPGSALAVLQSAGSASFEVDSAQSFLTMSGDALGELLGTPQELVPSQAGADTVYLAGTLTFDIFFDDVTGDIFIQIAPGTTLAGLPNPNVPPVRFDLDGPGSGGAIDSFGLIAADPNGLGGPNDVPLIVRDGEITLSSDLILCNICVSGATDYDLPGATFVAVSSAIADSPLTTRSIAGGDEPNTAAAPLSVSTGPTSQTITLPIRRESGVGSDFHTILEGQIVASVDFTPVPLPGALLFFSSVVGLGACGRLFARG